MIVKDVEIDENGTKHYVFGEDLEKAELMQMLLNQADTIGRYKSRVAYLHDEVKKMAQSITNKAPDLMLRKLTLVIEEIEEWDRERNA